MKPKNVNEAATENEHELTDGELKEIAAGVRKAGGSQLEYLVY